MKTLYNKITKTLILGLLLALFCPMGIFAQQVITFKSGYSCKVVVTYISADTVRYQLVSDPGMIHTALMSSVEKITDIGGPVVLKDKAYYEAKQKTFTRMTIAGGTILGTGAILAITGIIGMQNNKEIDYMEYEHSSTYKTYATITAASSALVVAGTIFTMIGVTNKMKVRKELKRFNVEVEPNPVISGVTVRLKF